MVRMVSSIAWCLHHKGKVHGSNGTAFVWKKIEKTEEISWIRASQNMHDKQPVAGVRLLERVTT